MATVLSQAFMLQNYGGRAQEYIVITPTPISQEIVAAAWSYSVRYTAKGLDLPDHDAAAELIGQRHPSWQILKTPAIGIAVNLALAEKDEPES
jgi:hypothetical protein